MKTICIFSMLMLLIMISLANANTSVSVQMVRSGDGAVVDTAYQGYPHRFQITIENDFFVTIMDLPFLIYSNDGASWTWDAQPNGYGDLTQAVTVIPGCRMDPPEEIWDMTHLLVFETDVNGMSPDTLIIEGVALNGGLPVGEAEPMVNFHFTPITPDNSPRMICIDSTRVPPSNAWIFGAPADPFGPPHIDGPFCWPVKEYVPLLGDFDLDGQISVGDPAEMIKYIFKGKPHFAPLETGDVNCDGSLNVGDVIFMIDHIFRFGPAPDCP